MSALNPKCAVCGELYYRSGDDIDDVRVLRCGCYAHKQCQKAGGRCREHEGAVA